MNAGAQLPMRPPSSLVITIVAERGRAVRAAGAVARVARPVGWGTWRDPARRPWRASVSPGCWMLTNSARPSGVSQMPVISQSTGPTRKRFNRSGAGVAPIRVVTGTLRPSASVVVQRPRCGRRPRGPGTPASIMQLVTSVYAPSSVWIQHSRVAGLNHRPSGLEKSCSAVSGRQGSHWPGRHLPGRPNRYTSQPKAGGRGAGRFRAGG